MKKNLFATTAIVAAFGFGASAANAQDASLNLSAFSDFMVGVASQDVNNDGYHEDDYDFSTNTEFEVNGEVTLDNGITFGMTVEVEADNNDGNGATDNIDENLVYVEGSFGTVELGHEDGAADTMDYGATSVKAVYYGTYNNTTGGLVAYSTGSAPVTTVPIETGDATKITYYSPRFAGLQFGVSHAPDDNADAVIPGRTPTETTDAWEAGVNYVNSFNGFDIAASLVGATENRSATGDVYGLTTGAVLGFGGFEFGGSVGIGEVNDEDWIAYDAGIGYSVGPWSLSLTGLVSEQELAGGGEDERYEVNSGVNYALGAGVRTFLSVAVGEEEPETGNSNEYIQGVTGVGVSF